MNDEISHVCEWLTSMSQYPFARIEVLRQHTNWSIAYESFASDQDVASGEADSIGELMGSFSISIRFCPFCGMQLELPVESQSE